MRIQMVIFDIDGVITDGKLMIDSKGNEYKSMDFRDIDAIFAFKRNGYRIAFVTGENTEITKYFHDTFKPDYFYSGNKDKANAVREISELSGVTLEHICYIGDGKYDAAPMEITGYSACPDNSIELVKQVAKFHLHTGGGNGCIHELMHLIFDINKVEEKNSTKESGAWNKADLAFKVKGIETSIKEYLALLDVWISSDNVKNQIGVIAGKMLECIEKKGRIMFLGERHDVINSLYLAELLEKRLLSKKIGVFCESLIKPSYLVMTEEMNCDISDLLSLQVEEKAGKDDVIIGFITSSEGTGLTRALIKGKKRGTFNIVFTGGDFEPKLNEACDIICSVPSKDPFKIQEIYGLVNRMIFELIEENLSGRG